MTIANSIYKSIRFTMDTPEDHENARVQMLDLQVWMGEEEEIYIGGLGRGHHKESTKCEASAPKGNISTIEASAPKGKKSCANPEPNTNVRVVKHSFYEKACISNMVLEYTSAMELRAKITTLVEEVKRRLRNTCRDVNVSERIGIHNTFIRKLKRTGYLESLRREILQSGIISYYRKVAIELNGGERVNGSVMIGRSKRERNHTIGKIIWWRYTPKMEGEDETVRVGWPKQGKKDSSKVKVADI